jgi:uncharacterized membrane protein
MAEAKLKQRAENDVEKRQAIKEGSKQASSRSECTKLIEKMKKDCSLSRWSMAAVNVTVSSTGKAYSAG